MSLDKLVGITRRIRQLSQDPNIFSTGPAAAELVAFVAHSICKLLSALQELTRYLKELQDLPGEIDVPTSLVSSLHEEIEALERRRLSAEELFSNVRLVDYPILLESTCRIDMSESSELLTTS